MRFAILLGVALVAWGCSERGSTAIRPGASETAEQASRRALVERGKRIYRSHCISCHNIDPRRNGSLGPANAGASRELVEARVLRADYPPGYRPKRDSTVMPAIPHLAGEIDALAAYLADAEKD